MIIGLIPAKGNSSRLKNKNFLKIKKRPLIDFTIEQCKNSKLLDNFYVSSENKKIINYCKKNNINFIKRPSILSKKQTPMNLVIKNFIKNLLNNKKVKTIVLIQPTSPIRPKGMIDLLIKKYKRSKKKCLISVKKFNKSLLKSLILKNNKLLPIYPNYFFQNSQELPDLYLPNGSIYIFDKKEFIKRNNIPIKNCIFVKSKQKFDIDIDSKEDFEKFKELYEKKSKTLFR